MQFDFVADESVHAGVIASLRDAGFTVISIREVYPGVDDERVLNISSTAPAILLTEDKDFGEWVFSHRHAHAGVILLRYTRADLSDVVRTLISCIHLHRTELSESFAVIARGKIRVRKTP